MFPLLSSCSERAMSFSVAVCGITPVPFSSFVILPLLLSIVITSPATIFSLIIASIIFCPKSYCVSISVVFNIILPVFPLDVTLLSISISTTSPSMISVSSLILTPIDLLNAWVSASVFDISKENISLPAIIVNGTSSPKDLAIAMAIAVFPVPGWPAINTARPARLPSFISLRIIPLALRASIWPTIPWLLVRGSRLSSSPRPRMWLWAPIRSILERSFTSWIFGKAIDIFKCYIIF